MSGEQRRCAVRRRDDVEATALRVLRKHCLKNDDRFEHGTPQARSLAGCLCDTWARDLVEITIRAERRRACRKVREAFRATAEASNLTPERHANIQMAKMGMHATSAILGPPTPRGK